VLLLDAGAFIAIERDDRDVVALIKSELRQDRAPITHGGSSRRFGVADPSLNVRPTPPGVDVAALDLALASARAC
jgi:hypothetical protein